ncbi:MAG: glycosyltransferase family 2 protein [Bacteroidales bacterium]|nr:glycosyltransferase family 2 protein [Bacteroidales bacterium]
MNPTVTIVLPCYNGANFLTQSIDSVTAQTFTDWELIIVNDCSTDNSLEIMQRYASEDSRIRIINNEHNLKLPGALNRGFLEARGKYLTWTSHDNRMAHTMLEEFVSYLDNNPDKGLVTACYAAFNLKTGEQLYEVHHPDPQLHLPLYNCVCYAFMYRREILETVGDYDTTLFLVEDYDYWVRIWQKYPVGKIYKVLYYTGVGDETLTLSRKKEIAEKLVEMRLRYFDSFNDALSTHSDLQRKFYISIADNLHGIPRLKFTFQRGMSFVARYWCYLRPKKRLGKVKRKLCHA